MTDGSTAIMDYDEHEKTYANFIKFSKVGTITVLTVVLCLVLFGFGGTAGTVIGTIMMLASFVGAGYGLASAEKSHVAPGIIFLLTGLITIVVV